MEMDVNNSHSSVEDVDPNPPEELEEYLERHPEFIRKWLEEKASQEIVKEVLSCCCATLSESNNTTSPNFNNNHKNNIFQSIFNTNATSPAADQDEENVLIQRNRSRSKRNSITSDRFQNWLSTSSPKSRGGGGGPEGRHGGGGGGQGGLESLDENALFIELVKDISNELDIDVLCYKILVNIGFLVHAQRCNLFLARGPSEQRYLVAKLIDVTTESDDIEEALRKAAVEDNRIPFGVGIVGHVAQTKEIINIKDTQEDTKYVKDREKLSTWITDEGDVQITCILAITVSNNEGDVIGVAQLINRKSEENDQYFTEKDIEVLQRYLTFCGIGIQNAQLFHTSVAEYRKNQLLLNLARSIFEEQTGLERLVTKIMKEAQGLLKCERCLVYLRDAPLMEASHIERILMMPSATGERKPLSRRESKTVTMRDVLKEKGLQFELVFELSGDDNSDEEIRRPSAAEIQSSPLTQIAKYVATNSEILNIGDCITWYRDTVDDSSSVRDLLPVAQASFYNALPKSILCMPIYNGQRQVIGVAQLINKANDQPFTDSDANTFEAFAIFCGLGIHNTQLYESACKLMAKQSVALECLSYHATASQDDTERLRRDEIASSEYYHLYSYTFNDLPMTDSDTCKATIRMFLELNLVSQFHIPYPVLCRWVLSVKKNYRPVKYHNWRHAFNVAQTMFTVLTTGRMGQFLDDLDILGLIVACLCHDLDHRGTNNAFQQLTASPLAVLYSTSTMEHHHFDQCVMILSSEGNNLFQDLSAENYRKVMKIVEKAILSTDLAMYFRKKDRFIDMVENGEISWQGEDKKELLEGMMMTACDVAAIAKPWELQHKIAKLVADEFFDQGDVEKVLLNQAPQAMMDRDKKDDLPKMQLGFIDAVCVPLYSVLSDTFPWLKPLLDGVQRNRRNWQDLAEKVDMGLTWIDYDVIENPVEDFSNVEPEDIDFVVQNLNCPSGGEGAGVGGGGPGVGDQDAAASSSRRNNKSKWKLTRLFRDSTAQLRKSTSIHSKTSSSDVSSPQSRKETGSGGPGTDEGAGSSPSHLANTSSSSKTQQSVSQAEQQRGERAVNQPPSLPELEAAECPTPSSAPAHTKKNSKCLIS